ncbi:hypothetical protein CC80DRAFT_592939 [Byssothecium circinans]|uniref:Uncharacterized protein n=1 Tax=Byssothecium circinans TaxID=147558 RepID=A0A6A5TVG5_9PLEO|nr:hypothetical protein CC80DRAFT_592939 [Byssothecium circinans]
MMRRATTGKLLTFDLSRVSSTPDVASTSSTTSNWTTRNGAFTLVFDTFRSGGRPSEVMRIMDGSQILYDVPLQDLIEQAKRISETARQHGAEVVAEQLPCSGLASSRSSMLALRYVVPISGLIRRFQMKFVSAEGYEQAYNHLAQLGLRLSFPKPPASLQRPSSVSYQDQGGSISCPPAQLPELSTRPFTAITSTLTSLQPRLQEAAAARPSSAHPRFSSPLKDYVYSSARPDSAASTVSISERGDLPHFTSHRPSSATLPGSPMLVARPTSSELPARREPPFHITDSPPSSRGSDNVRPGSRANAFMAPPSLPPPSRAGQGRPSSRTKSSHGNELSPLPMPTIVERERTPLKTPIPPMQPPNRRGSPNMRPTSAMPAGKENHPFAIGHTALRPSTSHNLSSNRPLSAVSGAGLNALPTPVASDGVHPDEYGSNKSNEMNDDGDILAKYATQPDEERRDALNERMLYLLEDPSFLALVGDVEISFARITPGFRRVTQGTYE